MRLKTFIQRIETYDFQHDNQKIIDDLCQLATNQTLLSEHLYNTIQRDGFSSKNSLYSAYAFVLHTCDLFTIRLGFWSPASLQDERETFIYDLNHSHDFELYAVGYCGDGYTTVTRKILDPTPIKAGVIPPLSEERSFKLGPGKVIHMLPLHEVHKQLPPKTMSASLSLLIHPPRWGATETSWCFDENFVPTYPGIATQETAFYEKTLSLLKPGSDSLPQ
ncbi:transposase [Pseudomonas sp. SWRI74]|uniref:Transposase n=1 Tax=Pseudomonas azerbaijanoccidentalis TaxID=2842347 RepID=A0ABS6QKV4_9PSED|nr:transposase [Pseudomonas azerbaijanoccidentalis]MBV4519566.1 transposase [Pseudomonas azerbaijanoccidentalis]